MEYSTKSAQKTSDRYLQVKYDWIEKTGYLVDACVMAYIAGWENSGDQVFVKLRVKPMADALGIGEKQCKEAIKRLDKSGMIGRRQTMHGWIYTTRKEGKAAIKRKQKKQPNREQNNPAIETKKDSIIEDKKDSLSETKRTRYRRQKGLDHNISLSSLELSFKNSVVSQSVTRIQESENQTERPTGTAADNLFDPVPSETAAKVIELNNSRNGQVPDKLKRLASQLGPVAERWIFSHYSDGEEKNDELFAETLRHFIAKGYTIRSPRLLNDEYERYKEQKSQPKLPSVSVYPQNQPEKKIVRDSWGINVEVNDAERLEIMEAKLHNHKRKMQKGQVLTSDLQAHFDREDEMLNYIKTLKERLIVAV